MTLDEIYIEMKNAESFVILTHENPDGDAIGSALSMALLLKKMGKTAVDIYLKDYPQIYDFLPGIEIIKKDIEKENYDMAIVVDCSDITRVNPMYRYLFEKTEVKVQFDHHNNNSMFADYNIVNPVSPACSQIIASSFEYLKIDIDKDIATAILTGIITDTYGFSIPETTAESFEFAGYALSKGVNVSKVYRNTLTKISKARFDIQNLASDRLEFLANGKICFTYITKQDEAKFGTKTGDLSSIVEIGRNIEGVEISLFLYEKEKGFKLSVRTNEYVDATTICYAFGGGGHLRAGGANLIKNNEVIDFNAAKELVITEAMKHLK